MNNDNVRWASAQPTIDTAAYGAGELLGTKLSFQLSALTDTPGVLIQSAQLVDQDNEKKAVDLVLFDSDPTATTFTNSAAFDIADADIPKIICVINFVAADYDSFADNAIGQVNNIGAVARLKVNDSSRIIYGALVAREAVTYTATTDLVARIGVVAL